MNQQRKPIEL